MRVLKSEADLRKLGKNSLESALQFMSDVNTPIVLDHKKFLVPGSSRVKDALGDTVLPAAPVLRSLFNLVPAACKCGTLPHSH